MAAPSVTPNIMNSQQPATMQPTIPMRDTCMGPPASPVIYPQQQIPRPFNTPGPTIIRTPSICDPVVASQIPTPANIPAQPTEKDKPGVSSLLKALKELIFKAYQHPYTWVILKSSLLIVLAIKLAQESECLTPLRDYIPFGHYDWESFREYWGLED